MTREPAASLSQSLSLAIKNYRETWQPVDTELYALCQRRPGQRIFADVYTKVAVIGRVYTAGISRSSKAPGDREAKVAHGLIGVADMIEEAQHDLAGHPFDRATAARAVVVHGRVTRGLLAHTNDVWLTSFVSKYLHFHCDVIPIYDSLAVAAIGRFVDQHAVAGVRATMADLPDWARAYRNFAAAFVVLKERIDAETPIPATVKEIDHLLWHSA